MQQNFFCIINKIFCVISNFKYPINYNINNDKASDVKASENTPQNKKKNNSAFSICICTSLRLDLYLFKIKFYNKNDSSVSDHNISFRSFNEKEKSKQKADYMPPFFKY